MNSELKIDGVSIDEIGIDTKRTDLTEQELDTIVKYAGRLDGAALWVLADMLTLLPKGSKGDLSPTKMKGRSRYDEIASKTGHAVRTLRQYRRIAEHIPHNMRKRELSFHAHHIIVNYAHGDVSLIGKWLDAACKQKMSSDTLKDYLRQQTEKLSGTVTNPHLKVVEALWHKRASLKKLKDMANKLDYTDVSSALASLEPCYQVFQALQGHALRLANDCDGSQDVKLSKMVKTAVSARDKNKNNIK